jgi:hypothetical protein
MLRMTVALGHDGCGSLKSPVAIILCRWSFCQFKGEYEIRVSGSESGSSKPIMTVLTIDKVEGFVVTIWLF